MKSRHQSPPAISGTMVRLAMSRALMLIVKVSVDSSLFVCFSCCFRSSNMVCVWCFLAPADAEHQQGENVEDCHVCVR